jgi:hypothetical protein
VVEDPRQVLHEVGGRDVHLVERERPLVGNRAGVRALVVPGAEGEFTGEPLEPRARLAGGGGGHDARVEPAGNVPADRDVGPFVDVHRVQDQPGQLVLEVLLGVVEVDFVIDLPVPPDLDLPAAGDQQVAGQQFPHVLEQGLPVQAELEVQVVLERVRVGLDLADEREEGLGLARDVQDVPNLSVVEGLDPEPVAGGKELLLGLVPQAEGEHPAELLDTRLAPLAVGVQDDLGVRGGLESLDSEFLTQLDVVVDLAVERDPIAVPVGHRLLAGTEIDDAEPAVGEADVTAGVGPRPVPVRPAVLLEVVHRP